MTYSIVTNKPGLVLLNRGHEIYRSQPGDLNVMRFWCGLWPTGEHRSYLHQALSTQQLPLVAMWFLPYRNAGPQFLGPLTLQKYLDIQILI